MTDTAFERKIDNGIAKATGSTPEHLKEAADRILRHVLSTHRKAHSGLFWAYVHDNEPDLYGPLRRHSYMVNGRWREAARLGLCRQTMDRHPTWLAASHQRNTVWESLIYRGNQ